jgi:hypothetical protein
LTDANVDAQGTLSELQKIRGASAKFSDDVINALKTVEDGNSGTKIVRYSGVFEQIFTLKDAIGSHV